MCLSAHDWIWTSRHWTGATLVSRPHEPHAAATQASHPAFSGAGCVLIGVRLLIETRLEPGKPLWRQVGTVD